MKKAKKCGENMECWSGFAGILGVAFIVVATILTLVTMNGMGILGMFIVGVLLCRRKMVICPCCESHEDVCGEGPAHEPHHHKPPKPPKKEAAKK